MTKQNNALSDRQPVFTNAKVIQMTELAKRYTQLQKEFMQAIEESLSYTAQLDGVKEISDAPCCFSVSFKALAQNGLILSPEYYSQPTQKEAVLTKLKNCGGDIEKMRNIIKAMIDKQRVEFAGKSDKTIYLNSGTIATLKKIYAGFGEAEE